MRSLVLALDYSHRVSYYDDWSDAFKACPHFSCTVASIRDLKPPALALSINDYDSVILLHSCNSDTLQFLAPLVPVLAERKRAKLLSFVGNEYNSPYVSTVIRKKLLREARVDIIATQLLRETGEYLYSGTGARIISVPHALNPAAFRPGPDHSMRSIDIGVKGYKYPPFLGDQDRNRMIELFKANAERLELNCDISEDQRIPRESWAHFLGDCRGTISTEVGSWFLEPDDALIDRIHEYFKAHRKGLVIKNDSFVRRTARSFPMPIKAALWRLLKLGVVKFEVLDDFKITFEELDEQFFKHAQRAPVYGKTISSRHFDAIGTKTCQIMLRGRYCDILAADKHYIAIDPNFGNLDDAVAQFRDPAHRKAIVDRAYDHVMSGHTYGHRTRYVFDEVARL